MVKMLKSFLALTLIAVLAVSGVFGQEEVEVPILLSNCDLPGLDTKVNLSGVGDTKWTVSGLVTFLAHRGGLKNIVIGRGVSEQVATFSFEEVTVRDALEVVLASSGLAYEIKGDIITIMLDEEYKKRSGKSFYENRKVKVIELKYADPDNIKKILEPLKNGFGAIVAES
jgi:hypothetical protein